LKKMLALIVAGGSGTRMQSPVPKQFLLLAGKPVLMHTLERFVSFSQKIQTVLVLPENEIVTWKNLCIEHHFTQPHQIVAGGKTRFASVRNGLSAIAEREGLVAIHDGVRPLVPAEVIARSFALAEEKGSAVAAVPLKDSLRMMLNETDSQIIDRTPCRLIQTPQTFDLQTIRHAYAEATHEDFTDDAAVAEAAGFPVYLTEGSYENLKITTPEDLWVAEAILRRS
jgi:2-C-methyl-D-erythritol 4-phosphate cytidylyltransferase